MNIEQTRQLAIEQSLGTIMRSMGDAARLFEEEGIGEIDVNPDGRVWVVRHGVPNMQDTGLVLGEAERDIIIRNVATAEGEVVTKAYPKISGVVPGLGARFEGVVPPAVRAPCFSIRLPLDFVMSLEEYVVGGILTVEQAEAIIEGVRQKRNMLIAGSTGSGKTTLSNAVLARIARTGHRVITIEDTYELVNETPNKVEFLVKRGSAFDFKDAVESALRKNPDRIVVGELRDGKASLELLKGWNTGHGGGLATIHANSARASLSRIETLLAEAAAGSMNKLVAEAINMVIFIERYTSRQPGAQAISMRRVQDVMRVSSTLDPTGSYQLEHMWHPSVTEEERQGYTIAKRR